MPDCGLSQVFGFTIDDEKVWFTEWVENNIGVLDTSIPLPLSIDIDSKEIFVKKGQTVEFDMIVNPNSDSDIGAKFVSTNTASFNDLQINSDTSQFQLNYDAPQVIKVSITVSDSALTMPHKVLLGIQTNDVTISEYVTVRIIE